MQNALLEFEKVVSAKQQVVSGTLYTITLEAKDGGQKKVYEAKVWEKSWLNFKEESWEWEEREELRQIDLHGIVLQTISQTRFVLEVFIKGVSFLRKPRVNRHCH